METDKTDAKRLNVRPGFEVVEDFDGREFMIRRSDVGIAIEPAPMVRQPLIEQVKVRDDSNR